MSDLLVRELTLEYVSGGYSVRPIDKLDIDMHDGELVLLLGASGCGKTTLLSALASILRPASGSIRIGDIEVTSLSGEALQHYRRHTVGIVFQAFNLVPSLSALENVQVPMWATGVSGREAKARAQGLLEQVGMADRAISRAVSNNASPSPERSPTIPRWYWPTSPPRTSTTSRSKGCCGCCESSPRRDGCW
jgi:putative ABC transport system ATP-binding protein